MSHELYLDHAASTPIDSRVLRAMQRAHKESGNPSSFNDAGRRAAGVLAAARDGIAAFLHARPTEIVLCSSGSEANAMAVAGAVRGAGRAGRIITTAVEHSSVLANVRRLRGEGFLSSIIGVDGSGVVDVASLVSAIDDETVLVSVMYANNEIGSIQPIARIGKEIARIRRIRQSAFPLFHVDACQATTFLDMDVQRLGVDLLTLNGAKAYGPHGSAALYVRRGVAIHPLVEGGSQEGGRRAGTEDVVSAVGLASALALVQKTDGARQVLLRDRLIAGIERVLPDARLNGPRGDARLANNVSISIPGTDSESLLLELDTHGIRAGSGSACTAHSVEPSHVLRAIGAPKKYLTGVIRFSLGRATTRAQVDEVIRALPKVVGRVRARSRR